MQIQITDTVTEDDQNAIWRFTGVTSSRKSGGD